MKHSLLLFSVFLLSFGSFAQWRYSYPDGRDHNHYSIEPFLEGTVLAGTSFPDGSLSDALTEVILLDANGFVTWRQVLDLGADERAFDVFNRGNDLIVVTGYAESFQTGAPTMFVLQLDGAGNVVNYVEVDIQGYDQSTGLDIIYSNSSDEYYIAGYSSNDIFSVSGDKKGVLVSLDASLGVNWIRRINGTATNEQYDMANDITELPGVGVYVTGMIRNSLTNQPTSLHQLYDYSGTLIWDLSNESTNSHQTGVEAVYDQGNDILYAMSNNSVVHTFEIDVIENASLSTATIGAAAANNLFNQLNGTDVAGYSIELGPEENLFVAGLTRTMQLNGVATNNSPTFIASVDRNTLAVDWFRYVEVNNGGFANHDIDVFQNFYWQQSLISYPDIMCRVGEANLQFLGYQINSGPFDLAVAQSDLNGMIETVGDCEVSTNAPEVNRFLTMMTATVATNGGTSADFQRDQEPIDSDLTKGCPKIPTCDISGVSFTNSYVDCYEYQFTATVNLGPGTTVTGYLWNWGDGSTSWGNPSTHQFSSSNCNYNVCVTVFAQGPDGSSCQQTFCQNVPMLVLPGCSSCGGGFNKTGDGFDATPSISLFPNPAEDMVTISLSDQEAVVDVQMMDISGRVIRNYNAVNSGTQLSLDGIESGNYFLFINGDSFTHTETIVVK